jgi:hypothetical protein
MRASPLWTLQRLCFEPDVAADTSDRGENRDPGQANKRKQVAIDKGDAIRERPPRRKGKMMLIDRSVGCRHVSGLCDAARMAAGPDAIRGSGP